MKLLLSLLITLSLSCVSATDIHYEEAKKHIQLLESITSTEEMAEGLVNGMLMSSPQHRPFKSVFIQHFIIIFSSQEYKHGQAMIYKEIFTLEELEYANKVFSDPLLASYMKKSPIVIEKSMLFGRTLGKKYQDKLNNALEARAKELEELSGKNDRDEALIN